MLRLCILYILKGRETVGKEQIQFPFSTRYLHYYLSDDVPFISGVLLYILTKPSGLGIVFKL